MTQSEQSPLPSSTAAERAQQTQAVRRRAARSRAEADNAVAVEDGTKAETRNILPLVAVVVALCFAASGWFFYHQGQRDALVTASPSPTMPAEDATPATGTTPLVADSREPESKTTAVETDSYGKPDIIVTAHPTAEQMQASAAAPAQRKHMLAKATRRTQPASALALAKVDRASIDRAVALASRPQPIYPTQALRAHEQGTVLVMAQVDVNGHVSDARIVGHSGSTILDRAAPNEVRRWKFSPALHDGQPIVASVEVPVSYRLDQ